ncbi:hypothetical protein HMI55_002146 [Coelomomyces lativittatus]|nr:hypothetical protein HMI55_002146 [Coelomomyces lativittatus]
MDFLIVSWSSTQNDKKKKQCVAKPHHPRRDKSRPSYSSESKQAEPQRQQVKAGNLANQPRLKEDQSQSVAVDSTSEAKRTLGAKSDAEEKKKKSEEAKREKELDERAASTLLTNMPRPEPGKPVTLPIADKLSKDINFEVLPIQKPESMHIPSTFSDSNELASAVL